MRASWLVALLTTGCLDLLGLDGDYVIAQATGPDAGPDGSNAGSGGFGGSGGVTIDGSSGTGGTAASGGTADTGGFSATGGLSGTGGSTVTDGSAVADGAAGDSGRTCGSCAPDQKCCQGVCIKPSPFVGCSMTDFDCEPCPDPPPSSDPTCTGETCTYECWPGFDDTGSECLPGAGGSGGGTGGTGGGAPMCDPMSCAPCLFLGPIPCCRDNGDCGCSYVADAYCWPRP